MSPGESLISICNVPWAWPEIGIGQASASSEVSYQITVNFLYYSVILRAENYVRALNMLT